MNTKHLLVVALTYILLSGSTCFWDVGTGPSDNPPTEFKTVQGKVDLSLPQGTHSLNTFGEFYPDSSGYITSVSRRGQQLELFKNPYVFPNDSSIVAMTTSGFDSINHDPFLFPLNASNALASYIYFYSAVNANPRSFPDEFSLIRSALILPPLVAQFDSTAGAIPFSSFVNKNISHFNRLLDRLNFKVPLSTHTGILFEQSTVNGYPRIILNHQGWRCVNVYLVSLNRRRIVSVDMLRSSYQGTHPDSLRHYLISASSPTQANIDTVLIPTPGSVDEFQIWIEGLGNSSRAPLKAIADLNNDNHVLYSLVRYEALRRVQKKFALGDLQQKAEPYIDDIVAKLPNADKLLQAIDTQDIDSFVEHIIQASLAVYDVLDSVGFIKRDLSPAKVREIIESDAEIGKPMIARTLAIWNAIPQYTRVASIDVKELTIRFFPNTEPVVVDPLDTGQLDIIVLPQKKGMKVTVKDPLLGFTFTGETTKQGLYTHYTFALPGTIPGEYWFDVTAFGKGFAPATAQKKVVVRSVVEEKPELDVDELVKGVINEGDTVKYKCTVKFRNKPVKGLGVLGIVSTDKDTTELYTNDDGVVTFRVKISGLRAGTQTFQITSQEAYPLLSRSVFETFTFAP